MRKIVISLIALVLLLHIFAIGSSKPVEIISPAVTQTDAGFKGVPIKIIVDVKNGTGLIFVDTRPLTQVDMQGSARIAARTACDILGIDVNDYDFYFTVRSDAMIVGGPSAGATMTIGVIASLLNWQPNDEVIMTGTINPDGSIGPVGGILAKAEAAYLSNKSIFLVPEGQTVVTERVERRQTIGPIVQITVNPVKVNVKKYAKERWKIDVEEVGSIYDAIKYYFGKEIKIEQPSSEVSTRSDVMKDIAEKLLKKADENLKKAKNNLDKSNLGYNEYSQAKETIKKLEEDYKNANKLYEQEKYYSAASQALNVDIKADYLVLLLDPKTDLKTFLKETEEYIGEISEKINSTEINSLNDIEVRYQAISRLNEANENLKKAWKEYYSGNEKEALYFGVFAKKRALTAEEWISLSEVFEDSKLSMNRLADFTRDYVGYVQTIVAYSVTILGERGSGLTSNALDSFDSSRKYLSEGDYLSSLASGIEAKVNAEIALETYGIENKEQLEEKALFYKENLIKAIKKDKAIGIEPISAMNNLEYGDTLIEDDPVHSMIFYKYGIEHAKILEGLARIYSKTYKKDLITEQTSKIVISNYQTPKSGYVHIAVVSLFAFVLGFLAGFLVRK